MTDTEKMRFMEMENMRLMEENVAAQGDIEIESDA